jgi:hypothetical protein
MPAPDPPPETSTETEGFTLAYSSAQAWARTTIVSEPEFCTVTFSGEETAASCSSFVQEVAEMHNKITEEMRMDAAHLLPVL